MKKLSAKSLNDSINLLALTLIRSAKWMNNEWKKKIAGYYKQCLAAESSPEKEFLVIKGNEMLSDVALLLKSVSK